MNHILDGNENDMTTGEKAKVLKKNIWELHFRESAS